MCCSDCCSCKCYCNCFSFTIFIIIGILGSIVPIIIICDSFIQTIPNYDYFEDKWINYGNGKYKYNIYYYNYYKNLKIIHEQYDILSDKRNLASIDLAIHFIILPTIILLSFIFSNCFVCRKKDYTLFIFFEIIAILLKGLCISDKILYEIKRTNLLGIDYSKESNSKIIGICKYYEHVSHHKLVLLPDDIHVDTNVSIVELRKI
jgi:hypothetical protein